VPQFQPDAIQANPFTLAVPPSEVYRIVKTEPEIRPGLLSRINSGQSLDEMARADRNGEIAELIAQ
jgi:stearoyl-CoA desaturase (delta-9 desaturase)